MNSPKGLIKHNRRLSRLVVKPLSFVAFVSSALFLTTISSPLPAYAQTANSVNTVVSTVSVGANPSYLAYDSQNNDVYVTNYTDGTVSVIDTLTNTISGSAITVGPNPMEIAYDSQNNDIYVANYGSDTVSVINGSTNAVTATITVGLNPYGVAYDSQNNDIYVTNYSSNSVSVIDPANSNSVSTLSVGTSPMGATYDASNSYVYVLNQGSNTVSVINGASNSLESYTISVGNLPRDIAYDSSNQELYVTNNGSSTVSVIDPANSNSVTTLSVGTSPFGVVYDPSDGYLYVSNQGDGTVSAIDSTNTVSTTTITGVTPEGLAYGNSYVYMANSITSGTVSVINTPGSNPTAPGAPTGLTATPGNGSVSLSWTAPSSNGGSAITGYDIFEGTSPNGESTTAVNTSTVTATSYSVTGLTNGTTYYFTVKAINSVGNSQPSNEASASPAVPATVPGAPTGLTATPGNGSVSLSWTAPSSDGGSAISGYYVFEGTSSGGESSTPVNSTPTSASSTGYTVTGLTSGTKYYFTVEAINSVGSSLASNETSGTPATAPGAPTGLTATPGNGSVSLSWTAPSSDGGSAISGYYVFEGTSSTSISTAVSLSEISSTSYRVTGLANGTTYYFTVEAVNSVGSSAQSNVVSTIPVLTISVGNRPWAVAYSSNGDIYVTNYGDSTVSVIDTATNSVVKTISVGSVPYGVAYSSNGDIYVANYSDNTVSVISTATNSVVKTISVGSGP